MGVSVKDSPLKAWAPTGVSPLHEIRWTLESHWGVSKLSSDLLMYFELLDSVFLGRTVGLNSVSLVKRKLVVLSCVASRQPMDSDPASLLLFPRLKRRRRDLRGASFLLTFGEKQPAFPDSTLLTACLLLSLLLFLLTEVADCLLDLLADDMVF